jgi:hypothetical protein
MSSEVEQPEKGKKIRETKKKKESKSWIAKISQKGH